MKKVLMLAPNYYTSSFQVGSHHYARAFEKLGYQVAYISDPISLLHTLFSNNDDYQKRKKIYKAEGIDSGSIWYYVPKACIVPQNKFILSSSFIMDHWHKFTRTRLVNILKSKGFDSVDILWFDSPLFHFLLDEIKYKTSILRLADYSKGLGVSDTHFNKELEIGNRVDKIIYTSKSILSYYKDIINHNKMSYMPNGIDLNQFISCEKVLPKDLSLIPSPRVIYIGAIDKWFDIDLVCRSALKYHHYSFVIIGKSHIDMSRLEKLSNIYILGMRPHQEICNYLFHSDIAIIPFKQNKFVDSINPLKLYEYLASGLKVVSMKWKEIENMEEYCFLADTKEEFIKFLAMSEKQNKNKKEEFLNQNSWDKKLKDILEIV